MKPVRTKFTNTIFRLPGGNEENDLPAERALDGYNADVIVSYWSPDEGELEKLMEGEPIKLVIWGKQQPPVAIVVGIDSLDEAG